MCSFLSFVILVFLLLMSLQMMCNSHYEAKNYSKSSATGTKNSIKIKTSEKILQNRHQEWRLMWSSNRSNLNSLFWKNPCIALLPNNLYSIQPYSLNSYTIIFLKTIWTSKLYGLFQKNNWMLVEIPKQWKTKCQIPPKDSHPTNKCIIDFYFL